MKNALLLALTLSVIAVSIGLLSITSRVNRLLDDTDAAVTEIRVATVQTNKEIQSTSQNVNALLIQSGLVADEARRAATEQRQYWNLTAKQTDLTVRAFRQLIDRTDRQLNDKLLPDLTAQTDSFSASAQASLAASTQAIGTLNSRLADPQISLLLGSLGVSAKHLADISANADAMSGDMKLAVHRLAKPPSKFREFLNIGWTFAKIGSLFIP